MTDLPNTIADALRLEDIEGLIGLGAPGDEYDSEAAEIAQTVGKLSLPQLTQDNIIAIIALVWIELFDRSNSEIEQRFPAFQRVARRILEDMP